MIIGLLFNSSKKTKITVAAPKEPPTQIGTNGEVKLSTNPSLSIQEFQDYLEDAIDKTNDEKLVQINQDGDSIESPSNKLHLPEITTTATPKRKEASLSGCLSDE